MRTAIVLNSHQSLEDWISLDENGELNAPIISYLAKNAYREVIVVSVSSKAEMRELLVSGFENMKLSFHDSGVVGRECDDLEAAFKYTKADMAAVFMSNADFLLPLDDMFRRHHYTGADVCIALKHESDGIGRRIGILKNGLVASFDNELSNGFNMYDRRVYIIKKHAFLNQIDENPKESLLDGFFIPKMKRLIIQSYYRLP